MPDSLLSPLSLDLAFAALAVCSLYAFYRLTGRRRSWLLAGILWLVVTGSLAYAGFFRVVDSVPPRLALVLLPMLGVGLLVGFGRPGRTLRSAADLEGLHYFHGIRILVETIFLHQLHEEGLVAEALTYHGFNFDLYMGILLPVVGYLVFRRCVLPRSVSVAANVLGILVLTWTIVVAVLSAPTPYQQFGTEQPTVAIFFLPYVWLPALVAPLMFWAHFICLGPDTRRS
ncbi:MAG: hypothetical protein WA952_03300 [Lewinella sp.]